MLDDCKNCFFEQTNKLFIKYDIQDELARDITHRLNVFISKHQETTFTTPEASCFLYRILKKALHNNDLYRKEKDIYNNLLMSLEAEIKSIIEKSITKRISSSQRVREIWKD